MKKILVLILVGASFIAKSNDPDTLSDRGINTILEILYFDKPLTADIIRKANPVPDDVVLFLINLKDPTLLDDSLKNIVLCGIGETQVIFIVNNIRPRTRLEYKEGTILLTVHWPRRFPLEKGSKIYFKINYRYQLRSSVIQSGEFEKEIIF